MAEAAVFFPQRIRMSLRFIQGYRYLDRCGEALIKLENTLGEGWIVAEPTPSSGAMKNPTLGMELIFNSQALTVQQSEFISFDHFMDQSCRLYDVIWRTLEIERINAPAFQVVLQRGYESDELDVAIAYLRSLRLGTVRSEVIGWLGGTLDAVDITLVTMQETESNDQHVSVRRRMETSVVRQEKRERFDERVILRTKLLPEKQREAVAGIRRLQKQHPASWPVAVQVDIENSWENEFAVKGFDLHGFLEQSWQWAEDIRKQIPGMKT